MKLYKQLKKLVDNEDLGFYSTIQDLIGGKIKVEIFSYRLCSWGDFKLPGALEARGITYVIERYGKVLEEPELICRPFHKFFNLGEGGMGLNDYVKDSLSKVSVSVKEDGSLIAFAEIQPNTGINLAKSKNSFYSDQAIAANKIYDTDPTTHHLVKDLLSKGYTPLFEYVSPDNQIVLKYDKPALILLGARHIEIGDYMNYHDLYMSMATNRQDDNRSHLVKELHVKDNDLETFITDLHGEEGVEGVVVEINDFMRFKVKTEWYLKRHRLKDDLNTEFKYVEAIVNEEIDDMIGLLGVELFDMEYVESLQRKIVKEYNNMVNNCEKFYEDNKELDRKLYAIKMTKLLPALKGPIMSLYSGKDPNYKEIYLRSYQSRNKTKTREQIEIGGNIK